MTTPTPASVVEEASGASRLETTHAWIQERAAALIADGPTAPRAARDAVNQPQIHTWLEALGEANPLFRDTPEAASHGGPVAPPAMAQVWTMYGLGLPGGAGADRSGDPLHRMMGVLDEAGFTSVLGTNSDQTYARFLRPGEHVAVTTELVSVVGPKRTGVGEGYFVTSRSAWWVGEERVATMDFRVLKFKPGTGAPRVDRTRTIRPMVGRDTAFFWEGTAIGELRIQRCNACGALRHPPGPVCAHCHATDRGHVVASGLGTVFSHVVHHAPQVPGKTLPLALVLVDLDEGVRMVGEFVGGAEPRIGDRVQVVFARIDDDLTLVAWEPVPDAPVNDARVAAAPVAAAQQARPQAADASAAVPEGRTLPGWDLPITTTLVVSTALATRDFQDVHHDRDLAVQRGTKDIFLNILTSTGLVQRYVHDQLGWKGRVSACTVRLGAPAYPGDTLRFAGTVLAEDDRSVTVEVVGSVSLGAHVTSTVRMEKL